MDGAPSDDNPRRYKHMTFRRTRWQQGWVVQYGGKTWGGFHKTQQEALPMLRAALGLPKGATLPRHVILRPASSSPRCDSASSGPASSGFTGISFHKRLKRWVANQFTLGKTFTTKEDAVKAVREAIANGQQPSRKVAKKKALTEYGEASQRKAPKSIVHRVACLAKACENIHM